jgi:hypothetical protein
LPRLSLNINVPQSQVLPTFFLLAEHVKDGFFKFEEFVGDETDFGLIKRADYLELLDFIGLALSFQIVVVKI